MSLCKKILTGRNLCSHLGGASENPVHAKPCLRAHRAWRCLHFPSQTPDDNMVTRMLLATVDSVAHWALGSTGTDGILRVHIHGTSQEPRGHALSPGTVSAAAYSICPSGAAESWSALASVRVQLTACLSPWTRCLLCFWSSPGVRQTLLTG